MVYDKWWIRAPYPVYKRIWLDVWQLNCNFQKLKSWLGSWKWNSLCAAGWHTDDQKWPKSEARSFGFLIACVSSSLVWKKSSEAQSVWIIVFWTVFCGLLMSWLFQEPFPGPQIQGGWWLSKREEAFLFINSKFIRMWKTRQECLQQLITDRSVCSHLPLHF